MEMITSSREGKERERHCREIPPTYSPSLVFPFGKKYRDHTFCTISDELCCDRTIPELRGMHCVGCFYGWLILRGHSTGQCFLFNPVSLNKIHLPPLQHSSYYFGLLTCSPTHDPDNCLAVFYSCSKKSIVFCQIGSTRWTEQVLRRDRKSRERMNRLYSQICCRGIIYMFFNNCIVVVDIHRDNNIAYVALHENRYHQYSLPVVFCHRDSIAESCGEIFNVKEILGGSLGHFVRMFHVFKMDLSRMKWVKIENLNNKIFLLGRNSMCISATDLGVKGNCIYYTSHGSTKVQRIDINNGTLTITKLCNRTFPHWREPFWVVPECRWEVNKEVSKVCFSKAKVNSEKSLKDLPLDILQLVLSSIFTSDSIRFRLACRNWLLSEPCIQSNDPLYSETDQLPWLMWFDNNKCVCNLYDPIYNETYVMSVPELAGAIIREAKYGWWLMSRGETSMFFFNPLTKELMRLPDFPNNLCTMGISFEYPPTSPYCIVFGHIFSQQKYFFILVYRENVENRNSIDDEEEEFEDGWIRDFYFPNEPYGYEAAFNNPVFFDDAFYCLSKKKNGKLGIFNPYETEEHLKWKILLPVLTSESKTQSMESFIVEHDGEILSIFVGDMGKSVLVFKLDCIHMKWVRLESLGDKVVFLSPCTSILVPAGWLKGIQNRIYFSRFYGEDIIFYSLSTGRYHCSGSEYSAEDWTGTSERSQLSWVQFTS